MNESDDVNGEVAAVASRREEESLCLAGERGCSDLFYFFFVCLINFKRMVLETFCLLMNVIYVTFSFWCYFGDKNFKSTIMENCPTIYMKFLY